MIDLRSLTLMLDEQIIDNMDFAMFAKLSAKMESDVLFLLVPVKASVIATSVGIFFF
nr:hypothetical protein [uncultured Halomonas sp.]